MFATLFDLTINLRNIAQQSDSGLAASQTPNELISLILTAVMAIAALAVFILLIWGGLEYITGGGEKSKIEAARNKITGAIIGIFVLASVVAIFNLLQHFLGINLLLNSSTLTPQEHAPSIGTPANPAVTSPTQSL